MTEINSRHKRILREIQLFKEVFPNSNITHKDLEIEITETNLRCIIKLPSEWPFKQPFTIIKYDNYTFNLPTIKDWNPIMDIRTIFYDIKNIIKNSSYKNLEKIENNIENKIENKIISSDDIDKLKLTYPNIKVEYCEITNSLTICLDSLTIIISKEKINVFEDENDWPRHMIPSYTTNISDIVGDILNIKRVNQSAPETYISKCKQSLITYFDDISYNENHQTFVINSLKYLIIIGININSQYLSPMVMIYHKGIILGVSYDFSNWNPDNLGKIIMEAIINYEKS